MTVKNICAAALALAALAGGAQAATYSAVSVIDGETAYGVCAAARASECEANNRKVVTNALGDTDGTFYALGLGGQLTLAFAKPIFFGGASVTLEEVTFGGPQASRHFEAVDVYSVLGGVSTLVDTVLNTAKTTTLRISQTFEHIRLVDVTPREFANSASGDGFDVDSVIVTSIAPVPVPAAGVLMFAGIGGLAMLRRRKAAA